MALSTFKRRFAPLSRPVAAAGAFGLAGASLFAASPALAAEFECEAVDGLPAPVLVADGVCEIVITSADAPGEDPTTFVFPASMGKIQAVVVGAGGGGAAVWDYDYGAYGGGGGQVAFVDEVALDTPIDIIIGEGGEGVEDDFAEDGGSSYFAYSSADEVRANGGYGADFFGGGDLYLYDNEADGFTGDEFYGDMAEFDFEGDLYYFLGGGAGANGDAIGAVPGPGFVLSDLVAEFGADADLFPAEADSVEYGKGGEGDIEAFVIEAPVITDGFEGGLGTAADVPPSASGQGGNATWYIADPELGSPFFDDLEYTNGADGAVILRYGAAVLAATGADATPALAAGAVAAAAGAALVGVSARRRRMTAN